MAADLGRPAVVAFGGNTITRAGQRGTAEEQATNLAEMASQLAMMIEAGWSPVVTHGNGPQVGNLKLQQEAGEPEMPAMPLDMCGAMSQGQIGYQLEMELTREFYHRGISRPVVTLVTRCVVDPEDPAFLNPTKPIGPFYDEPTSKRLRSEKGWAMVSDSGRGYRRVVPSPAPVHIMELESIQLLARSGSLVIACGGGGIPVLPSEEGSYRGVEAVIDKDFAAALLAKEMGASTLVMLTDVPEVLVNFGKPNERKLSDVSLQEIQFLAAEGHFPPGSMGPKIEAAADFLSHGGQLVVITSPAHLPEALTRGIGTRIRTGERRLHAW